jgi:CO dehydrogenase nickel-insertion accessory protein CooC1
MMVFGICKKTIETIDKLMNSITPPIGALRKFRERISALTNTAIKTIMAVPNKFKAIATFEIKDIFFFTARSP